MPWIFRPTSWMLATVVVSMMTYAAALPAPFANATETSTLESHRPSSPTRPLAAILPWSRSSLPRSQARNPPTTQWFHGCRFHGIDRLVAIGFVLPKAVLITPFVPASAGTQPVGRNRFIAPFLPRGRPDAIDGSLSSKGRNKAIAPYGLSRDFLTQKTS